MASIGWNYGRPQLRIGWTKDQAALVAQNKVKKYAANDGHGGAHIVEFRDYMVELVGADGSRRGWSSTSGACPSRIRSFRRWAKKCRCS